MEQEELIQTLENLKLKMEQYQNDMNVDINEVKLYPGIPFVHILRNWGTQILFFHEMDHFPKHGEKVRYLFSYADRDWILNGECGCFIKMPFTFSDCLSYRFYDGKNFREISVEKMKELVKAYQKRMNQIFLDDRRRIEKELSRQYHSAENLM